jgi:hypothetical protein
MTRGQLDNDLIQRVCCGNPSAMDFLANYWSRYVHEIDDIIDGERPAPEDILATFALAVSVYAHPFYLANLAALKQLVLVINSTYADAVAWEKSEDAWQREFADHHRHVGMDMVVAVAQLCGGYEHGRNISREQRAICYHDHHNRKGEPT